MASLLLSGHKVPSTKSPPNQLILIYLSLVRPTRGIKSLSLKQLQRRTIEVQLRQFRRLGGHLQREWLRSKHVRMELVRMELLRMELEEENQVIR